MQIKTYSELLILSEQLSKSICYIPDNLIITIKLDYQNFKNLYKEISELKFLSLANVFKTDQFLVLTDNGIKFRITLNFSEK